MINVYYKLNINKKVDNSPEKHKVEKLYVINYLQNTHFYCTIMRFIHHGLCVVFTINHIGTAECSLIQYTY